MKLCVLGEGLQEGKNIRISEDGGKPKVHNVLSLILPMFKMSVSTLKNWTPYFNKKTSYFAEARKCEALMTEPERDN